MADVFDGVRTHHRATGLAEFGAENQPRTSPQPGALDLPFEGGRFDAAATRT